MSQPEHMSPEVFATMFPNASKSAAEANALGWARAKSWLLSLNTPALSLQIAPPQARVDREGQQSVKVHGSPECETKMEFDYWRVLLSRFRDVRPQSFRMRLPGCWYKPDFYCFNPLNHEEVCGPWFFEVKGPHRFREKGILKLKAAAHEFPWARWVLVQKVDGRWKETVIPSN